MTTPDEHSGAQPAQPEAGPAVPRPAPAATPAPEAEPAPPEAPLFAPPVTRQPPASPTAQAAEAPSPSTASVPPAAPPVFGPPAMHAPAQPPGSHAPGIQAPHAPHAGAHQTWPPGSPAPDQPQRVVRVRRSKARRSMSVVWVVPMLLLALAAGVVGGLVGGNLSHDDHLTSADLPTSAASGSTLRDPGSVAGIASGILPSVVSIEATSSDGTATGTGFVLREDGYLLTNNHVVASTADGAGTLTVTFADGHQADARIVGRTSDYDLAVVKVDEDGLDPLVLGNSDDVVVGDPVVAVGAPLGLAGTVTTGIVSAKNRPVSAGDATDTAFINAIQTDAAINPGNSGGPLVDGAGEVIGINSAIAQPPGGLNGTGGSIGLGFAIPSNQARRTAEQLIETGHATYPVIGVLLDQSYTGEGVKVSANPQQGGDPVTAGGPADKAGIRAGDVILAIDGRPVTDPDELIVAIRAHEPGDVVELKVRTGKDSRTVRVTLDEAGN